MRLKDKKCIVTGGAAGIGSAIAEAFVREGAQVALLDINADAASMMAERLNAVAPHSAFAMGCDVGYSARVVPAIANAVATLGGLHVLVNNAGVISQSPVVSMEEDEWDRIIRTNLKSIFLCCREAARVMIRQGQGGRIISLSSIHAVLSEPNCGHYTASKGGIEGFSRTLATELAPHKITVNFIRPGATYTELTTPMYTENVVRALFERVPLKEIAQASWIAAGAVFLASDEARYMTGQSLTMDGGYVMDGSLPGASYWTR